jgi:hypothetical protein
MKTRPLFITLSLLAGLLLVSRLLPHAANWGPALAIGTFSGFLTRKNPLGFLLPVAAWVLSDLYLGFYPGFFFNYAALLACGFLGWFWHRQGGLTPASTSTIQVGAGFASLGVLSSSLFFMVSNLSVWAMQAPQCQPLNWQGLVTCYTLGLPFYWPTLISTTAWMLVFAGVYQFMASQVSQEFWERA